MRQPGDETSRERIRRFASRSSDIGSTAELFTCLDDAAVESRLGTKLENVEAARSGPCFLNVTAFHASTRLLCGFPSLFTFVMPTLVRVG